MQHFSTWIALHFRNLIGDPEDFSLEERFLNGTWLFSVVAGLLSLTLNIFLELYIMVAYSAVFTLLLSWFFYLSRYKRKFVLLTWIFVIIVFVAVPLAYFLNGGAYGVAVMATLMCVLLLSVILKGKTRNIVVPLLLLMVSCFFFIEMRYPQLIRQYENERVRIADTAFSFIQFGFINYLIISFISVNYFRERERSVQAARRNYENELEKIRIDTEMQLLRQQMNPHFIYNSLNSIQCYISENNTSLAERYLARFARLMRCVLEQTRNTEILLSKELESLQLYIELEQLRFSNSFEYIMDVHPDIDREFVQIPSMLIQPYVENAILHGLNHKETKGILKIFFQQEGSVMICTIEDDGVGREKSAAINKSVNSNKKSLGHSISEDRITLLNRLYHENISIRITDLTDQLKEATGTRVIIRMPCL